MLREPLVGFLAGGVVLFLLFGWLDDESGPDVILANEAALVQLISYRDPRLDGSQALTPALSGPDEPVPAG